MQAVEAELETVDRLGTVLGQAAVGLAQRIEQNRDTGSALAALNRELRATVAEAVKGAGAPRSAISRHRDELAARRRA